VWEKNRCNTEESRAVGQRAFFIFPGGNVIAEFFAEYFFEKREDSFVFVSKPLLSAVSVL
jgi:hypothetical protein